MLEASQTEETRPADFIGAVVAAVAVVAIASVIDRSGAPVVATSVSCALTTTSISAPGVTPHCVSGTRMVRD